MCWRPRPVAIKKPERPEGVTIGVARASTQDTAISAVAPQGTQLKRFDDDATALQALISGQVQAMGASNTILAQLNKDYPQMNIEPKLTLKEQANGMAFRKADTALAEWSNKFIAEIAEERPAQRDQQALVRHCADASCRRCRASEPSSKPSTRCARLHAGRAEHLDRSEITHMAMPH
jgi:ABC-type amino acid transport substrate-binding protein